jgi:hypothetical protein
MNLKYISPIAIALIATFSITYGARALYVRSEDVNNYYQEKLTYADEEYIQVHNRMIEQQNKAQRQQDEAKQKELEIPIIIKPTPTVIEKKPLPKKEKTTSSPQINIKNNEEVLRAEQKRLAQAALEEALKALSDAQQKAQEQAAPIPKKKTRTSRAS